MSNRLNQNYLEYCEYLNRVACSTNVVAISRIKGPLTEAIMRQALVLVQRRHPCLNYRIMGTSDDMNLEVEGAKIPLRVVRKSHDSQWQDIVLEEANQKIDSSQALLRAVLFCPENETTISYLITTTHHGIADLFSNSRLHGDILTYCQKVVSGESTEVSSLPTLPPMEALIPASFKGFRGKLGRFLFMSRLVVNQLWYRPKMLDHNKRDSIESSRAGFVNRKIDKELTQSFINSCKRKEVSTNGALCSAMMFTAAQKIESAAKKKSVSMCCCATVSLRKSLEQIISEEHIAMLSSSLFCYSVLRPDKTFWELAKELGQKFQFGLMDAEPLNMLFVPSKKMAKSALKNANDIKNSIGITVISGIAKLNIPESYGNFELEEFHITGAAAAQAASFCVIAVVFREKLSLNFFYPEPLFDRETIEYLADNVVAYLKEASKEASKEELILAPV
ncbi:MAG: alcohol acetyltransferase [Cyanobacteria bacterium P01_F01_bin.86]